MQFNSRPLLERAHGARRNSSGRHSILVSFAQRLSDEMAVAGGNRCSISLQVATGLRGMPACGDEAVVRAHLHQPDFHRGDLHRDAYSLHAAFESR